MFCLFGASTFAVESAHAERPRSEVSIGFLTHKAGPSFVDYHYTVLQSDTHSLSVGLGTLIAYAGLSLAWKYYPMPSIADIYTVFSLQHGSGMGNAPPKTMPVFSIGIEFLFWDNNALNLGVTQWITTGLQHIDEMAMDDYMIMPQASYGWRW